MVLLVVPVLIGGLGGCRRTVDTGGDGRPPEVTLTPAPDDPTASKVEGAPAVNTPTPTPTRAPPESTAVYYTVRYGDTLSGIAAVYGTTTETLMRLNGLDNADQLAVGQKLQITLEARHTGPAELLLPDSELVYGPGHAEFDVVQAVAAMPGRFGTYTETVMGRALTGPEIVGLVAEQYSVGPRVLLTLLELRSGWLTDPEASFKAAAYPLGYDAFLHWDSLYAQLSAAADALNVGFYGWWMDTLWLVQTRDGGYIRFSPQLNAATAGVQRALAPVAADYEAWVAELAGFRRVYRELFGDPFAYAVEPLMPPGVVTPTLVLPWPEGETWYYTGGPHPGWGTQGVGAALDFATGERNLGCRVSREWVTAAAEGLVVTSRDGMILQDLDGDGKLGTGWVLVYMHIAAEGRVAAGTRLTVGDRVGHPSCEGGVSNASHLHLARRYNGVWIAADDARWPMALSGWVPASGAAAYDGTLTQGARVREACECWDAVNAVRH
jgi:LysM repeat protein